MPDLTGLFVPFRSTAVGYRTHAQDTINVLLMHSSPKMKSTAAISFRWRDESPGDQGGPAWPNRYPGPRSKTQARVRTRLPRFVMETGLTTLVEAA